MILKAGQVNLNFNNILMCNYVLRWSRKLPLIPCVIDTYDCYRLESLVNLNMVGSGVNERFAYGKKIAQDLFQYMCSFSC